jgi:hypothetical protein
VLLARFVERVSDICKVDQAAHMEGRSMIMILVPEKKKKVEPKAEGKGEEPAVVKPGGKSEDRAVLKPEGNGEDRAVLKPEVRPTAG